MYGLKVRKQYAALYKEAMEKLAFTFGVKLAVPLASPPREK